MAAHYIVKNVVFESGERFAQLVDARTGIPLFDITVFTLTEFRSRNRASATIEQVLRSLKILVLFCDLNDISLDERMRDGRLLEMGEIDALVRLCRLSLEAIEAKFVCNTANSGREQRPLASLETYRARTGAHPPEVAGESAGVRVRYIRQYLGWLADRHLLHLHFQHPTHVALLRARNIVIPALDARVPSSKGRNKANARKGLTEAVQRRLWQVIRPDAPDNPWVGEHARVRNELIVRWFMGLGVRRGELLGVKVGDVDLKKNEVFIARRADDKSDPRNHQPNTKTADRLLVLSDDLAKRIREYVINVRRKIAVARQHPFLFVANGGQPLSIRGLNKIFIVLRQKCPDLPDDVFPHILRHTWNDNFSIKMDEQGVSPEHESKIRSRLMGWNPTSKTAAIYQRRTVERMAREASLKMQENMMRPEHEI